MLAVSRYGTPIAMRLPFAARRLILREGVPRVTYTESIPAYHCLLGGAYHIDDSCPVGRMIPSELRATGPGAGALCRTCELRLAARDRRRSVNGA